MEPIKIDVRLLGDLSPYQGQWIAVSRDGKVVSNGADCEQVSTSVPGGTEVALFKVPTVRYDLFPSLLDQDDFSLSAVDYSVSDSQLAALAAAHPAGSSHR
jgi:hypothetical protein